MEEIRQIQIKGIKIRTRARWIEEGEKPTKYFCSLESRQYRSKRIPKLYNEGGSIVSDTKDILEKQVNFYSNLYTNSEHPI